MNVLEINKYAPSSFQGGRFRREDWTSCSQIGELRGGAALTPAGYLEVEDRYVRAVRRFVALGAPQGGHAHDVEYWDTGNERAAAVGLGLPAESPPAEGDTIADHQLDDVARRCLREIAWLELILPKTLLVHFGYDLRLIVAISQDAAAVIEETKRDGLFVYPGDTRLPTLDEWRGLGGDSIGAQPARGPDDRG